MITTELIEIIDRPISAGMATGGTGRGFIRGLSGSGKTTLVCQVLVQMAMRNYTTIFITDQFETTEKTLNRLDDLIAGMANKPIQKNDVYDLIKEKIRINSLIISKDRLPSVDLFDDREWDYLNTMANFFVFDLNDSHNRQRANLFSEYLRRPSWHTVKMPRRLWDHHGPDLKVNFFDSNDDATKMIGIKTKN